MSEAPNPIEAISRIYNVRKILSERKRIRTLLAETWLDKSPIREEFDDFIVDLLGQLPKTVKGDKVADSLAYLAGEKLTKETLNAVVWRMLGNLPLLCRPDGGIVPPWTVQPYAEWVPAQFVSARRGRTAKGKPGHTFTLVALAGLCAGLKLSKFWTDAFCRFIRADLGFARFAPSERSGKVPQALFQHPLEFVQLRITVLVEPKLCTRDSPGFERTRLTSANLEWNKEQLKYRDRLEPKYQCIKRQPSTLPCYRCPFGVESCRVAVHPKDYVFTYCKSCQRHNAPFDPLLDSEVCLACYERRVMTR